MSRKWAVVGEVNRRADRPRGFFEPYYGEKIDLKYVKIAAGTGIPLTALQVSDSLDPLAWSDALGWAKKNIRRAFVIHCGNTGGATLPEGAILAPGEKDPDGVPFAAKTVAGINFVAIDDSTGTVTAEQAAAVKAEFGKGQPVVLVCHVPFYSEGVLEGYRACVDDADRDATIARQRGDATTQAFWKSLRDEPLLKGVLAGHLGVTLEDDFSATARQYVVGANTNISGEEVLFA